ncbi:tRNA(Ile)-lysidine synthase [bioreactor metagenome]|uniref:tRNA(Ile)-lysidine synthetase n=1 Tax=bioreactor metagenome TaxID=1076179 RepID=A0A644UDN5_9ZZZZ|nr:tRNA lysidine(34) synthetase TilS [Negativicutes bacterium]
MLKKVKAWIDSHKLLASGDKIIAACSGGPDSLALVHILQLLAPHYQVEVFVAHVDHMIRGQQSAEDAAFVAAFCRANGLVCYQTAVNVPQFAELSGRSIEDAAREQRYAYLRHVAAGLGGAKIATGHHRDDQAETVLINLLRGAGSGGLRGMQAKNGSIIRPLLPVSRSDVEQYCRENQLTPRLDSTNLEVKYLRNRVRLKLLPLLEEEYNPGIKDALFRTGTLIADQHDYIHHAAIQVWPVIVRERQGLLLVNNKKLLQQHAALQREILRLTIEKKQGNLKGITFQHVERLVTMARDHEVGSILELPGRLLVKKNYEELMVGWQPQKDQIDLSMTRLTVPGITYIEQLDIAITAELCTAWPEKQGSHTAVFDWQMLTPPFFVRTRQPGDRFKPLGLQGTKKLKDFFVDGKIPQQERDRILLVCDSNDIIWVAGHRQAQVGRVTAATQQFLQLTIKQVK